MATLVFFKAQADNDANSFRGTWSDPGDPPAVWDLLTRDPLIQSKISFKIVEYGSAAEIPYPYNTRVKKPLFLTISGLDSKTPLDYPAKNALTLRAIKDWILKTLDAYAPTEEFFQEDVPIESVIDQIVDDPSPVAVVPPQQSSSTQQSSTGGKKPAKQASDRELDKPPSKPPKPIPVSADGNVGVKAPTQTGQVIGASMIIGAFVAAGVVLGNLLTREDSEEEEPDEFIPSGHLVFVKDDGTPVLFDEMMGEENEPE